MAELAIHENALKHGLAESDVKHAWNNALQCATRIRDDGQIDQPAAGFSPGGKAVEMVGREKGGILLVFHAMTPITDKFMSELKLTGR